MNGIAPLDLAVRVAERVRDAGGRALIVGGWVRDRLMGVECKDIDIEVFGLDAPTLKRVLEGVAPVNTVGESFTVYKVAGLDVSLPRRESKTGRGHRGFAVEGDPDLPPIEAARRRDFTINAISWDPLTAEYVDPFDGRGDIRRQVLRAVDPRTFVDDSLRVLRAVQFAARFEFVLDAGTKELCRRIGLDDLPAERIWGEIEKLLMRAARLRPDSSTDRHGLRSPCDRGHVSTHGAAARRRSHQRSRRATGPCRPENSGQRVRRDRSVQAAQAPVPG
jgi:tRNA nucleotidyltransferase (CCA-adding enzyme)